MSRDLLMRERDYYRDHCDDLGKQILRLQEEQTRARCEATRSRTTALLVRKIYHLAESKASLGDITREFLRLILDTLKADRAALLARKPEESGFIVQDSLGFPLDQVAAITEFPLPQKFCVINSRTRRGCEEDNVCRAAGVPFALWDYDPRSQFALLLGNASEDPNHRHQFGQDDWEITEGVLGVLVDIVARRLAEQAMRKSEERYRTLVENINVGIYRHLGRPNGRFLQVNSALARIHGYPSAEAMMCVPMAQLFHDPQAWQDFLTKIEAQGFVKNEELQLRKQDDTPLWASCSAQACRHPSGQIEWIDGVLEDITERKTIGEQLMAAKESAEAANHAKSQFLANMSHEVRTPLSGIAGTLGLLRNSALDHRQRRHVEMAVSSTDTLLRIINEILDFSKIEAGKLVLDHVDFCPHEIVQQAVEMFTEQATAKDLTLTSVVHPQVPSRLHGDPMRLEQVLLNLLSNALKFTETGEITLTVGLREKEGSSLKLQFAVQDTGIGVPLEDQNQLFDSFTQLDASTSRRYGGTGLGLAICRQLVEIMNGEIGVDSPAATANQTALPASTAGTTGGPGSRFWFTVGLEMTKDQNKTSRETSAPLTGQRILWADHHTAQRILLVEDNDINREVAAEILKEQGYFCCYAANGQEAVEAVSNGEYDLVLMDCQMPIMDGYEATRRIRAAENQNGRHRIPIVALTAHAMTGDRERCLQAGMDDYLTKPLHATEMLAVIQKWLAQRDSKRLPEKPEASENEESDPGEEDHALRTFDYPALLKRCLGKADLVAALVAKFHEQAAHDIDQLQEAIAREDPEQVTHLAHRIKGAAANLSAQAAADKAALLQRLGQENRLPEAREEFIILQHELEDFKTSAAALLPPPPGIL